MKPDAIARWEKSRAKGKLHFILVSGVLSWGVPMFIAMTFFVNRERLSPGHIILSAFMWLLGGAGFGLFVWYFSEKQYQKTIQGKGP